MQTVVRNCYSMKMITKMLIVIYLLTLFGLLGQTSHAQNKYDSSFTLTQNIRQDKLYIGHHGVFFYEQRNKVLATKQVVNDFKIIESLSIINLANFRRNVTLDSN